MAKTIFVLLDGCGNKLARENLGFLEHMAEAKKAARYTVMGQLPAMSRPLYETLLTGVRVCDHGISNNFIVRLSKQKHVFGLCRENSLTTAASAYNWISELYNKAPFSPLTDRIQSNNEAAIQNGIFYFEDDYPDSHVFADAEYLRNTYDPDFLMIHTMGIDHAGHLHGGDSKEQAEAAIKVDIAISLLLPELIAKGYNILITADHGMGANGFHGGNTEGRLLPLYLFAKNVRCGAFDETFLTQLAIAPLLCALLEISPEGELLPLTECGVDFFA